MHPKCSDNLIVSDTEIREAWVGFTWILANLFHVILGQIVHLSSEMNCDPDGRPGNAKEIAAQIEEFVEKLGLSSPGQFNFDV